jgi:AmmeMemoRadiSam system protein B/AmmeMemoRadiSam system protein A
VVRSVAVREAAVAGTFYPGDPVVLRDTVDRLLADAPRPPAQAPVPRAVIVPHAGYIYSGPTAAAAYARIAAGRDTITRVVLVGPTHRVPVLGVALPGAEAFRTPLGTLPVAEAWAEERLADVPAACVFAETHRWEHSVEVQIPFLQRALGDIEIVPMLAGDASGEEVADVLDALWGGPETLVVISSDLSHYLGYDEAAGVDAATISQILALEGPLNHSQACGATPINGLLVLARRHGLVPTPLDARNSGDTSGDRDRVVGYCAIAFDEAVAPDADEVLSEDAVPDDVLPEDAGALLLPTARAAIESALGTHAEPPTPRPAWALAPGASFVTLTERGELRGCIGSLEAVRPLLEDVADNAVAAATRDPRFPPLTARELDGIAIEVSVLSAPVPLAVSSLDDAYAALRPGVDGVIAQLGPWHRATFLPQVWEQLPEPEEFLSHLWRKAGVPPGEWREGTTLQTYTVRAWHEGR